MEITCKCFVMSVSSSRTYQPLLQIHTHSETHTFNLTHPVILSSGVLRVSHTAYSQQQCWVVALCMPGAFYWIHDLYQLMVLGKKSTKMSPLLQPSYKLQCLPAYY